MQKLNGTSFFVKIVVFKNLILTLLSNSFLHAYSNYYYSNLPPIPSTSPFPLFQKSPSGIMMGFFTICFSLLAWFNAFYETYWVKPGSSVLTYTWNCPDMFHSGYLKINIGEWRNVWLTIMLRISNDLGFWTPSHQGHSY